MTKNRFKESDLHALGLFKNEDGSYSKEKPIQKPIVNKTQSEIGRPSIQPTNEIFIPGQVMSSKNSRRNITLKDKSGKPIMVFSARLKKWIPKTLSLPSKAVIKYKDDTEKYWRMHKEVFLKMAEGKELPLRVQFRFARKTKMKADFHNLVQILCDLMQDYEWIVDDDMDNMVPVPTLTGPVYTLSKTNPGVYISVL